MVTQIPPLQRIITNDAKQMMAADGDGSTTESEEFFDGEGDDDLVEEGGGNDPLGGVSAQSSSLPTGGVGGGDGGDTSHVTAATTGAGHVKQEQELLVPIKRFTSAAGAIVLPSASSRRFDVLTAVKHEPHVTSAHQAAPPPHMPHAHDNGDYTIAQHSTRASRPSLPATQSWDAVSAASPSHASASSTQWPPLPPSAAHASSVANRGPQFNDYRAPVAFQASRPSEYAPSYGGSARYHIGTYHGYNSGAAPFRPYAPVANGAPGPSSALPVYGYHPPPPVNYAPPRTVQAHYQRLAVSRVPASNINTNAKPTTMTMASSAAAPPSTSYSAPSLAGATVLSGGRISSQCRGCFAKLSVPPLKIGRDCRCCGLLYPFSQFPMQNNQDKSPHRRCHACYASWVKKNTVVKTKSTHSAVLRSQQSIEHMSLPSPLHVAKANKRVPRFAPIPPPPRMPSSLAAQLQQPAASRTTQADAVQSSTSALLAPTSASALPLAAAPGRKCLSCMKVTYSVQPSRNADTNLKCVCCLKILLKNECFSKSQRKGGKHRCRACLGQVKLGSSSEPPPVKELSQITQTINTLVLRSEAVALSAEWKVAKYHLARRSLQRKREANDLRGSTRIEYEKQLAKEDAELKVLEKQLRAKYPQLFDKQVGIQVLAPSIPRSERDRPDTTRKIGKPSEKSELRAKKKREQETTARLNSTTNAVINSAIRRSTPEIFDLTGEPSPEAIALANLSVKPPKSKAAATPARVKATMPKAPAVTTKPAAKPTTVARATANKRKETAASTSTLVVAKEKQLIKKSKTSTTTANDDYDEDPWLAAHDEIAQGLSQLLGGNLDEVLGVAMEKEKKVKTEAQRADPSTYAPKTKLQAETPPRTTTVTRARKRSLQPPAVEIIDMTDSPRSASPKEMKKMRFFI